MLNKDNYHIYLFTHIVFMSTDIRLIDCLFVCLICELIAKWVKIS